MTRMAGGQKTVISWQDAPDDLFFRSTPASKKVHRFLSAKATRDLALTVNLSSGISIISFIHQSTFFVNTIPAS